MAFGGLLAITLEPATFLPGGLHGAHALLGSAAFLASAVVLSALSAGFGAATLAAGSAAALGYAVVAPVLPMTASAIFALVMLSPRGMRARSPAGLATLLASAATAGAAVSVLAGAAHGASPVAGLAAFAIAVTVAAVPFLVPVDDRTAFALRGLAEDATGWRRTSLVRALIVRRSLMELRDELAAEDLRRLDSAFDELVALAQRRSLAPLAAASRVDAQVAALGRALTRTERALRLRSAARSPDRGELLAELEIERSALEAEAEVYASHS
jgi:hypothetical protein